MAKRRSKKTIKKTSTKTLVKTSGKTKVSLWKKIKNYFQRKKRPNKVKLHKSFRRSYREDYKRDLEVPGIMHHVFATFKIIFKNWKLFLPLLVISVLPHFQYRQFPFVQLSGPKYLGIVDS